MTKTDAVNLFGSVTKLSESLGVTRQAIYQWPEVLAQRTIDEINGAAIRVGLIEPKKTEAA